MVASHDSIESRGTSALLHFYPVLSNFFLSVSDTINRDFIFTILGNLSFVVTF